ncbi:MAG TPA: hypothetical protein VMS17_15980 [Gemmataceae bacterium]|nr:hypothetical protein [Gemmataceae bacterium]
MKTNDETPAPADSQSGVRACTILCLTGLMGMVLALLENDRDLLWILFVAGVGAVGVVARWRVGPVLVLLGLALLEVVNRTPHWGRMRYLLSQESLFLDAVLAASMLTYAAGHYRLLSLTHSGFPVDARRRPPPAGGGKAPAPRGQRRSADLPGPWELPTLAIAACVWGVGVSLLWVALSAVDPPLSMSHGLWRGLLLILLIGLTASVLGGAAVYLNWVTARPEEHLLYLHDAAWRETRREQNRINRFLAWARLRRQRRKEQS